MYIVSWYDCVVTYDIYVCTFTNYNLISAVSISLYGLIDLQRNKWF